jgi:hypothetical protein
MLLADLPPMCTTVLAAAPVPGTVTMREAFALKVGVGGNMPTVDAGLAYVAEPPPSGAIIEVARLPRPRPEGR